MTIRFPHTDGEPFSGWYAAEKWCREHGYSVGMMQGPSPVGLLKGGDWAIQKWRNLRPAERARLDGTITFDNRPRDANVTVTLKTAPVATTE